MTDRELLHQFAASGDQEAFASLVARHGGMVHAAAARIAGRSDSDDVAQAVFVLLARKAHRLGGYESLAGWLWQTACLCARNAKRARLRRIRHTTAAGEQAMSSSVSASQLEAALCEQLDRGLARLNQSQRQAVILRYIEGLSIEEAAHQAGVSAQAIAKRSERGLTKLRDYLAAHGYAAAPGVLSVALAKQITGLSPVQIASLKNASAPGAKALLIATLGKTAAVVKIASLVLITAAVIGAGFAVYAPRHASTRTVVPVATSPIVPVLAGSTTKPAGATTAPVGVTEETGKRTAEAFFTALRDRDAATLSNLIVADTPQAQRAAADRYITQFRNRAYARFPQRLGAVAGSAFAWRPDGTFVSAAIETQSPIDADMLRLTTALKPVAGNWRITDAKMSSASEMFADSNTDHPDHSTTETSLPLKALRKALEEFDQFQRDFDFNGPEKSLNERSKKITDKLTRAPADVRALAATLKSTKYAIKDDVLERLCVFIEQAPAIYLQKGEAALEHRAAQSVAGSRHAHR
jgi:RNA polymerase sigma factor (sigma-70 family)